MIKLYKLTDSCGKTRNDTQWGPGVSHSGTGEGELCGPGWIHAYEHPLIAVLLNPIHASFKNPRLWEAEGEIAIRDGQLKCGCKTLTTVREIPLPSITTEMRVRFAILCAKEVCACLSWNAWADRWLSGEDRSGAAAGTAAEAAWAARAAEASAWAARTRASAWAARAAEASAWAARTRASAWAASARASAEAAAAWAAAGTAAEAAWAARAAEASAWAARTRAAAWAASAASAASAAREVGHGIDIFEIAEKACSGLR